MFSTPLMWLRDTGILNKLKYDVMNPPIPIPDAKVRHNQPLILRQLGITVIILVVGLFIALILFLGELCNNKKKRDIPDAKEHFEILERTIARGLKEVKVASFRPLSKNRKNNKKR